MGLNRVGDRISERLGPLAAKASVYAEMPAAAQFGFWLLVIAVVKSASLLEPPVWDSAMGVFPPAIFLYESGFDIRSLLQQGNWWSGGPNVHSLSIFTWFIAVTMALFESPQMTFLVVHLATFALVAWSLALFGRTLSRDGFSPGVAVAATALVLLLPLVLVQVGYLYTESWVMALSVASWAKWCEGKPGVAVALAVTALFVKLTAIAIVLCLAIALLVRSSGRRARWLGLFGVLIGAVVVHRLLPGWLSSTKHPRPGWGNPDQLLDALLARLATIPDITLLVVAGLVSGVVVASVAYARGGRVRDLFVESPAPTGRLICLLLPFVFAAGIASSIFSETLFLPRYLIPMLPFCIASLLYAARCFRRESLAIPILVLGCVLSVINHGGRLYSPVYDSFSIVERSHAYMDFQELQIDVIEAVAQLPDALPVYVSKEVAYMTSSPMMGYVDEAMPRLRPIFRPPYRGLPLSEFPDEFVLVYSNAGHGGQEMARLVQEAQQEATVDVRSRAFERNEFRAKLFLIRRTTANAAAVSTPESGIEP